MQRTKFTRVVKIKLLTFRLIYNCESMQEEQWYAGKCVTTSFLGGNSPDNICWFPWHKYSHHGQFQANNHLMVDLQIF